MQIFKVKKSSCKILKTKNCVPFEVQYTSSTHFPTKTLRGNKNLSWVTQEIRRKINLWDHLYQVQKNGNNKDQQKFKNVKYEVDSMIKTSYSSSLDSIVGIIDYSDPAENACPNTKKNFLPQEL